MAESEAERKAREAADKARAAEARAAAESARRSGHDHEANLFETISKWVEET